MGRRLIGDDINGDAVVQKGMVNLCRISKKSDGERFSC
jgi:hypothetical protein